MRTVEQILALQEMEEDTVSVPSNCVSWTSSNTAF